MDEEIDGTRIGAIDFDAKKAAENFRTAKEKDFSKLPAESSFKSQEASGLKEREEDTLALFSKEDKGLGLSPQEVIDHYNEFAVSVGKANTDLTPAEVKSKIIEVERKFDYQFFGIQYPNEPNRELVNDRHRLLALRELNLISEEENQELQNREEEFQAVVGDISGQIADTPEVIRADLESILVNNMARNYNEAKKLLLEGPIIEGFDTTSDPRIPNEKVTQFLQDTFTKDGVRKAKIAKISKNDLFQIFRGHSDKDIEEGNELHKRGIAHWEGTILVAKDKEHYLQASMFLEGVDDPSKVRDIYKVRATAGDQGGFHHIELRGFGIEKPEDFDYLTGSDLDSDEEKMRAYILSTVSHEFAHRFGVQGDREAMDQYNDIVESETSELRKKYVSDYVLRHDEIYGSKEDTVVNEDFAESVRIYTLNSRFLEEHYPRRFAFIKEHLPFVKADNVVEFARSS